MDEFYTRLDVARECWSELRQLMGELGLDENIAHFIEPSAGDGVFYDLLPSDRRVGYDIEPRHPEVECRDFLAHGVDALIAGDINTVVIGNPPFGKRGKLAVQFFVQAARTANTIGFIVPIIFRKYFIHKQLPADFRWVRSKALPRTAFRLPDGKPYAVNAEFQIWTRIPSEHTNMRLRQPPPIAHGDFSMYQYNNTVEALKVFENDFDFAVPCQGWQDYSRRVTDAEDCERSKQWMLLKARDETVLKRLRDEIDYSELALRHTTTTPGFRKGDLVEEYLTRFGP